MTKVLKYIFRISKTKMENLMVALDICFQLFEMNNGNEIFPFGHSSEDYKKVIEMIDHILTQHIKPPYPENFLAYKLEYFSWARECIRLETA